MFQINKSDNSISRLEKKFFAQLKFKEREQFQEWIAKEPGSLGEELLIIQKDDVSYSNEDDWSNMITFLLNESVKIEKAFREPVKKINIKT